MSAAGKVVEASPVGTLVTPLWRKIEWAVHKEAAPEAVAAQSADSSTSVNLYPQLLGRQNPEKAVIVEFGKIILGQSGEAGQAVWAKKLDVPSEESIRLASAKLKSAEVRAKSHGYSDVLKFYPDRGHSVDRLVFINVANALLMNNIAYRDSVGVDIYTWGPTTEYCSQKRYHSLIPLVSAYAPADVYECYGCALYGLSAGNLSTVLDKSVAQALRSIIERVARGAASINTVD